MKSFFFFFSIFIFLIRVISFCNVLIYLYFWLCWIFVALHRLLCRCWAQASHCREHELQYLQHMGLVVEVQGPCVWALLLWHSGLVALQCMESSQTRDQTHVPCIGKRIPIHYTTKKVWNIIFCNEFLSFFERTSLCYGLYHIVQYK